MKIVLNEEEIIKILEIHLGKSFKLKISEQSKIKGKFEICVEPLEISFELR